jgi:hypothetical protein
MELLLHFAEAAALEKERQSRKGNGSFENRK